MSKDKPEAGDIWQHKKHKELLYITDVGSNYIKILGFDDDVYPHKTYRDFYTNTFSELREDPRYTLFTEIFEYKGKAKASINNLFETAAEAGIKNNPTLQTLKGKVNFLINEIGELSARGAFAYNDDCALRQLCKKIKELMEML